MASAAEACPPGDVYTGIGCSPCQNFSTPATLSADTLNLIFSLEQFDQTTYTVSNGQGCFNLNGAALSSLMTAPACAALNLPPISGSGYSATVSVPSLAISWSDSGSSNNGWTAGASGVTIAAEMSATFDFTVHAYGVTVTPTMTVTNLPLTIAFGTDGSGDAAVQASQITVGAVSSYATVSGCGAFGWCTGLVKGSIESAFQAQLPGSLASGFYSALNGVQASGTTTPFFLALLNGAANSGLLFVKDGAGNALPRPGESTPGGATLNWACTAPPLADPTAGTPMTYANSLLTGTCVAGPGLCYLDCTPGTSTQLCGANGGCGTVNDGCGGTFDCPGACTGTEVCTNNQCVSCTPAVCGENGVGGSCSAVSDGCGGTIVCDPCSSGEACVNGACVGTGGTTGNYCKECRASGGICTSVGGKSTCVHE